MLTVTGYFADGERFGKFLSEPVFAEPVKASMHSRTPREGPPVPRTDACLSWHAGDH